MARYHIVVTDYDEMRHVVVRDVDSFIAIINESGNYSVVSAKEIDQKFLAEALKNFFERRARSMTAAEYTAAIADKEPIETVRREVIELQSNSPSVKAAGALFWTQFWKEITKKVWTIL